MNNVQQYSSFRSVEFSDQDSVLPLIPAVDGQWNVLVVDLDHQLVRPELVLGFRVWCEADAHSMVGWGRGGGYVQVCKLDGAFAQCKPSLGTEQNSKLCILQCVCVFIGMPTKTLICASFLAGGTYFPKSAQIICHIALLAHSVHISHRFVEMHSKCI